MPLLIPVLAGVSSFFAGAYIGNVVEEANKNPSVVIEEAEVSSEKSKSNLLLIHGLIGIGIYLAYKKWGK